MSTSPSLSAPESGDHFERLAARRGLLTARDVNAETLESGFGFGYIPSVARFKHLNCIEAYLEYKP